MIIKQRCSLKSHKSSVKHRAKLLHCFRFIKQTKNKPGNTFISFPALINNLNLNPQNNVWVEQHPYLWLWSSEFSKHVSGLSRCDQCLSVFSQLCSFNWRQAGEYVNEGWHSLLHDNSRSNSRLASQTILTVKFKLKSEASQATCGLFQFLQLLQVLQLLSRERWRLQHTLMSSLQTSENKII